MRELFLCLFALKMLLILGSKEFSLMFSSEDDHFIVSCTLKLIQVFKVYERFFVYAFLTQKYPACQQCHQLILSLYFVLRSFQFFNLLQTYFLKSRIASLWFILQFYFLEQILSQHKYIKYKLGKCKVQ